MWRSEADIIAQECVLTPNDILSTGISSRIVNRLGEGANTKIAAFVEVNEMMTQEVGINLTNTDRKTEMGITLAWFNNLQSNVAHSFGMLWSEIGRAALQQTADAEAVSGWG